MLLTLFVLFYQITTGNGLKCAACVKVTSQTDCRTSQTCYGGDRCYTASYGVGMDTYFDMGCRTESECLGTPSAGLVGRSLGQIRCRQCCAIDHCNDKLCFKGTLVDGAWSLWSPWSACDVTCGTGKLTRSRTCTDPPPAHGGLPCAGNTTDTKQCTLSACPIHGGWGNWKTWSSCSNTCRNGTQARHRSCDTPIPQLAGNHCFGDNVDFRTCLIQGVTESILSRILSCLLRH